MLLEFFNTRTMRECRNLMREALRDNRDKGFVKSVRIEEFLPSELLPRKKFLHRIVNASKQKFKAIKLFRVSLSRKHFDLRVFIRLNLDAERDNKAAGRSLTWAEIDEKTLSELIPFDPDIFRERTFSDVVRATPAVPQPMGSNVQPPHPPRRNTLIQPPQANSNAPAEVDGSGDRNNRMDIPPRNLHSPQDLPRVTYILPPHLLAAVMFRATPLMTNLHSPPHPQPIHCLLTSHPLDPPKNQHQSCSGHQQKTQGWRALLIQPSTLPLTQVTITTKRMKALRRTSRRKLPEAFQPGVRQPRSRRRTTPRSLDYQTDKGKGRAAKRRER